MDIRDFDAKAAQSLVREQENNELIKVLNDIRTAAMSGDNRCFVYKSLKQQTITMLEDRGFDVKGCDSISIQKDSLYYMITW